MAKNNREITPRTDLLSGVCWSGLWSCWVVSVQLCFWVCALRFMRTQTFQQTWGGSCNISPGSTALFLVGDAFETWNLMRWNAARKHKWSNFFNVLTKKWSNFSYWSASVHMFFSLIKPSLIVAQVNNKIATWWNMNLFPPLKSSN